MSACVIYSSSRKYQKHTNLRCSGQCEWHGNGMVCVNPSLKRQGNSRGTAWKRHGMCESALRLQQLQATDIETHTLKSASFIASCASVRVVLNNHR
jgi:hypothetical protein